MIGSKLLRSVYRTILLFRLSQQFGTHSMRNIQVCLSTHNEPLSSYSFAVIIVLLLFSQFSLVRIVTDYPHRLEGAHLSNMDIWYVLQNPHLFILCIFVYSNLYSFLFLNETITTGLLFSLFFTQCFLESFFLAFLYFL